MANNVTCSYLIRRGIDRFHGFVTHLPWKKITAVAFLSLAAGAMYYDHQQRICPFDPEKIYLRDSGFDRSIAERGYPTNIRCSGSSEFAKSLGQENTALVISSRDTSTAFLLKSAVSEKALAILKIEKRNYQPEDLGDRTVALLDTDHLFGVPEMIEVQIPHIRSRIDGLYFYPTLDESCPESEYGQISNGRAFAYTPHDRIDIQGTESGPCWPSESWKHLEPLQIQKIAILDMIINNDDRNARNLLRQGSQLVPIDHDRSMRSGLEPLDLLLNHQSCDIAWMGGEFYPPVWNRDPTAWKLLKKPIDARLKNWIQQLDIESRLASLRSEYADPIIYAARIRTAVLKRAVKAGYNLQQIYHYMTQGPLQNDLNQTLDRVRKQLEGSTPNRETARVLFYREFKRILKETIKINI